MIIQGKVRTVAGWAGVGWGGPGAVKLITGPQVDLHLYGGDAFISTSAHYVML